MRALLLSLTLLLATGPALAADLTINTQADPAKGPLMVALFDRPDAFEATRDQQAVRRLHLDPNGSAQLEGLPPGRYAVAAFQDGNGNGQLEKNFLGLPQEPYAFSRNARRPSFEEASFELLDRLQLTLIFKD